MTKYNEHISVYLNESIKYLSVKPDGVYVDCTLGRCGHTSKIIDKLKTGYVLGIDRDLDAINYAKSLNLQNIKIVHDKFSNLDKIFNKLNLYEVDGFLFDLGVSSPQLDDSSRGFSYHNDAELDMRMDQSQEKTAKQIVNSYSLAELKKIFYEYGESKYSSYVANAIIKYRANKQIETTLELVDIIKNALPKKELIKNKHPAKVFFQALRIEVNDEINEICKAIKFALCHLKINGRLVVISFHSLENKVIKNVLKEISKTNEQLSYLPAQEKISPSFKIIKHKELDDINTNSRSRSARLHIIEREY